MNNKMNISCAGEKMKSNFGRIAVVLLAVVILALSLCACSKVESKADSDEPSMFVKIENVGVWLVVYHRDTKVMYVVSNGGYNAGDFTVLLNPDGTPMLYSGD